MGRASDRVSRILAVLANLAPSIVLRFWVGEVYIYIYIRVCLAGNPRDEGEGKGVPVLIDGFRYVNVEFEWMVIKRGKGEGGREKKCAHSWLSFQVSK